MPLDIEDYAMIGDGHATALVGRDGSIDWLCMPRFDSGACFAALLGKPENGRWLVAPVGCAHQVDRRYSGDTLILETDFVTETGSVRLIDFMPLSDDRWDVVRIVVGLWGTVPMHMELVVRFDYGSIVPWVRKVDDALLMVAGPDSLELRGPIQCHGENMKTVSEFNVAAGDRIPFVLTYQPSYLPSSGARDADDALTETRRLWESWSRKSTYAGRWQAPVIRSLITLKALIYEPTGGMVAAPTTSLPEQPQGVRNWDYRFCWLRDSTFTLNALLLAGYTDEAMAWQDWLLRAVAGAPADMQILYSVTGERRLDETELGWLPGYLGAAPVRLGNAAAKQLQLDVYGEVMDTLHLARSAGLTLQPHAWKIQRALLKFLEAHWNEPDEGLWEVRGPRRHFTHSKVMAWVAFDRAVKAVERFGFDGPVDSWRSTRDRIHAEVCARGFNSEKNSFVQHYETADLDASLLLVPLVGFLPPHDPRVRATIDAIQRDLVVGGLVTRYSTATDVDSLPAGEGAFLPCSFWLADCLAVSGRREEAEALFERLVSLCNDVGLLAEEFDPRTNRMLGNFPQALSHMALVNTARILSLPQQRIADSISNGERCSAAS